MPITDRTAGRPPARAGIAALTLGFLVAGSPLHAAELAFPGAEGYGAGAIGWKGGALIAVTTLDESGPGSLRDCVERDGPRVCIFRVAGTIRLSSPLMVRSNVYIAGQSAPGQGIQLRNA